MRHRGLSQQVEGQDAMQNLLVSSSARFRQLERFNFKSNTYNFDGVNPELAIHLLSLYWDRQLDVSAVIYRPLFMRDMACGGPYFSKLLLNAIYLTASKFSPRLEVRDDDSDRLTAGRMFRRRITELVNYHMTRSEITTVQALLLRSLAWLYSGMAINMIMDLGIQTDHRSDRKVKGLSSEESEMRKRLFWGAYGKADFPKFQSLYQGRPIRLREADASIPLGSLDEYEEYDQLDSVSYGRPLSYLAIPARYVSTLRRYCSLSIVMPRMLETLYTEHSVSGDPSVLFESSASLGRQLQSWYDNLHPGLTAEPLGPFASTASPHTLTLAALYHTLQILLHRPFVSDGHLRSVSSSVATVAFEACVTAVEAIHDTLNTYSTTFSIGLAPYSVSYATYVKPRGSYAHNCLPNCLVILREHELLFLGSKRVLKVILSLIQAMGVEMEDQEAGSSNREERTGRITGFHSTSSGKSRQQARATTDVEYELSSYDMDIIIGSFDISQMIDQQSFESRPPPEGHTQYSGNVNAMDFSDFLLPLDPLFGLYTFQGML
ncbi:hypothetical protein BDV23DRAFT_194496 [Aspergillus alliaceus]|uniref:Xylanolytic transcriptional activator regulatory domain-containing protein n=1 Tax=Petromyces alliaceus TaxID=209559 RepID=A0A5N7C692_PETAA|nr:hypothetical protein BDV23DRAFT_194496 [Aspergillus alliaceus]